jgi:hypothetical protein
MSPTTEISSYEQQALDFLKETGTTFQAEFLTYGKHFADDTESRDIYLVTLQNRNGSYSFRFGQSIANTGKFPPTEYDVLACLQKHEYRDFEDFCSSYGYYTDSRKAFATWEACYDEFLEVQRLFTEQQIEKLQEIQ